MKIFPIGLIIFGLILIYFPEIIAYLLGGFFILIGINMLVFSGFFDFFSKRNNTEGENYVKFGKYKIYK